MTDGWTTLLLPMVNASTLCLSFKARCFFALLFVARMANNNPHKSNQGGTVILKRKRKIICLTNTRTTHISRLRKGIGLVMKPGEADSCSIVGTWGLIVRAGHMSQKRSLRGQWQADRTKRSRAITWPHYSLATVYLSKDTLLCAGVLGWSCEPRREEDQHKWLSAVRLPWTPTQSAFRDLVAGSPLAVEKS